MMERISIQEIAATLVAKNGLKKKEAERFALTMFDVVKDGLVADRLVKIKGLGTFKIIDIESRLSVNVNTGERVMIDGHDKITFTPDAALKELVNKPFSQFETVILNDGVEFDDGALEEGKSPVESVGADAPEVAEVTENQVKPDVTESQEVTEVMESPEEPEVTEVTESSEESEAPEKPKEPETPEEPKTSEKPKEPEKPEVPEKQSNLGKVILGVVLAVAACAGSFYAGYRMGQNSMTSKLAMADIATPIEAVADSTETAVADSIIADSTMIAAADSLKMDSAVVDAKEEPAAQSEPAKANTEPAKTNAEDDDSKFEKMDARVRTGAYRIVGDDYEVKVKPGETLARVARRTLGPDMECYIEVYNGLTSASPLQEGQSIKIPKLQLKKKKKQSN